MTAVLAQSLPAPPSSPAPSVDFEYDANGNRTNVIQAKGLSGFGFSTQTGYDGLQRPRSIVDAHGKTITLDYNGREDLTSVRDPRLLTSQYVRNGLGDVKQLVSPDTGSASQTYDAAGNLKTRTDSRGVLATYNYDALDRVTSIAFTQSGQPSRTVTWTYDETGAGFSHGVGRLTTATHPDGSNTYGYDPQGRLIKETQVVAARAEANPVARTLTVEYAFQNGRLSRIIYPSGRVVSLAYANGAPSNLALAASASAANSATLISGIQFEPFGAVSGWQWQMASGTQAYQRIHDSYGRPVRYRLGNVVRDVRYDAADRIVDYTHYDAATAAARPGLNQSFGYDLLGRLTNVTSATSTWIIGYDDNGNRTSVTLNGVASTYTVSSTSNRLQIRTNPLGRFGYDAAGNTVLDHYTATYDLAGRLSTLTKAGVTTTYTVDGNGRRVRKFNSTGPASTVLYMYDSAGNLLGEYDNTGAALREYVWFDGAAIAMFTPDPAGATLPPLVYYLHSDHLGAPRAAMDTSNRTRWRWMAEPFGTTPAEENPSGLGRLVVSLRFPGQVYDAESGLHYNYSRDFDPRLGRYTQSDPIGLAGGINTYAYVGGNPISYVDPDGLQKGMPQGTMYRGTGDINGQIWIGNQMRDGAIQNFSARMRNANDAWGPKVQSVCLVSVTNVPQKANQCTASNPTGAASQPTTGPVMSAPGQGGSSTCLQWGLTMRQ